MGWISVSDFKTTFAVAANATTAQVEMAIAAAEDELVELVGQPAVDDTLADSPSNSVRAARIVRAHQFLAAAIHCLNVRNLKRAQDSGSPTNPVITNEYWNPKDIAEMRDNWRALAMKALSPYLLIDVADDNHGEGIEYSHPVIGCTNYCQ